jgi:hypothetical protein
MTHDDILRMADEAYELAKKDLLNGDYLTTGFLAIRDIHFHRLATAAEREACAKVCEDIPLPKDPPALTHLPTIERCANAIRARGNE